jgi:dienelactone hydrolase
VAGHGYSRKPFLIVERGQRQLRKDVYGSIDDAVVLQAQHLADDRSRTTALVGMHPVASPGYLPFFSALARGGAHVVACATRYTSGDAALQMENVLLDLGACVRHVKEELGYEKVVLVGWSGGGALMAGYQAEAHERQITCTAAGEPTRLTDTELLPGDGLVLVAAHRSRHHLLTDFIDPSVTDERDPEVRDPRWNLYDPANPDRPPFATDYLRDYRAAQLARNRRITAWAKDQLETLQKRHPERERSFVVHGTMADPRWLDPSVDPNGRRSPWCYLGDPAHVNDAPSGLARYTTTRSWLSQWSFDDAQVDAVDAGPRITVPTLVMANGRDDAVPTTHPADTFAAIASTDKAFHELAEANHYFNGSDQRSCLSEAVSTVTGWLDEHAFTN